MAYLRLCTGDPLMSLLYDVFGANVVRVPDTRIQPGGVIALRDGRSHFRGMLAPLLRGDAPLVVPTSESDVADISGRRSRAVALDLGLHILRGFLAGLGMPAAGVSAQLQGVSQLAFSFPAVRRRAVDSNQLGRMLGEHTLEPTNPAAAIFFGERPYSLLVIDSVLISSRITLRLAGKGRQKLQLDVEGLQQIFSGVGARAIVTDTPTTELHIESPSALSFAFSCVRLYLDREGAISAMPPDLAPRMLGSHPSTPLRYSPDRVMLGAQPGLVGWDML